MAALGTQKLVAADPAATSVANSVAPALKDANTGGRDFSRLKWIGGGVVVIGVGLWMFSGGDPETSDKPTASNITTINPETSQPQTFTDETVPISGQLAQETGQQQVDLANLDNSGKMVPTLGAPAVWAGGFNPEVKSTGKMSVLGGEQTADRGETDNFGADMASTLEVGVPQSEAAAQDGKPAGGIGASLIDKGKEMVKDKAIEAVTGGGFFGGGILKSLFK